MRICQKHNVEVATGKKCPRCNVEQVTAYRKRLKRRAIDHKGGKCEHCGYNKCSAAMEFHHTDPSQKDFSLSVGNIHKAWSSIQNELDKCKLLCANCHREEHVRLNMDLELVGMMQTAVNRS